MTNKKIFKVHELNKYMRLKFEEDFLLNNICVQGEISNLKNHSSGHLYFTLKDSKGSVNTVMFKTYAESLKFESKNGMKIIVQGYVSMYEKTGQVQLYCENIESVGIGSLQIAFEQLKEKLLDEGLFDDIYKKEIPTFPKTIAVITSPTGAAVRDIINVATRRNDSIRIVIVPVLVQGENAKKEIKEAIEMVNRWNQADVIILGRGGGSIEDLWAFNEEIVARAIFRSKIPIISAVGHETDFTIADFVSDMRAPTPSAAAELAVWVKDETSTYIKYIFERIENITTTKIESLRNRLKQNVKNKYFNEPENLLNNASIHIENIQNNLTKIIDYKLLENNMKIQILIQRLENKSPLSILKNGYIIAEKSNGKMIMSVKDVVKDEEIKLRLSDGEILVKII